MSRLADLRLRSLAPAVALMLTLAPSAAPAAVAGEIDLDLRLGAYTDVSESFLGVGVLTRLGSGQWFLNPNFEYVFVDRGDLTTLNADFHYDLHSEGETDFWLGAGAALIFREGRRGNDDTEVGLNLLAGASFLRHHAVRPYLQGKLILSDETEAVVAFGLRF